MQAAEGPTLAQGAFLGLLPVASSGVTAEESFQFALPWRR